MIRPSFSQVMHPSFASRCAIALAAMLAASGPVDARPAAAPLPALPAAYDIPLDPALPTLGKAWWSLFGDAELDALITRAHTSNLGIAQAAARLAQARAAARFAAAAQRPVAGIDGSATHAEGPLINAAGESGDLFTARLSISWEADILGRLSAQRAADRQDVLGAEALLQGATLLVEAEIARQWFISRHYAMAAADAGRISALLQQGLQIAAQRETLGLAAPAASEAARRRLDDAREREETLCLLRDRARRELGSLLGQTDAIVPAETGMQPDPPAIPAGLPAELLERRPDILAARAAMMAADDRLRGERRSWLPALGLTASGGAASPSLGQLLSSAAGSFGIGALLALPVFDGGRRKARIAGRAAMRDETTAAYSETVLNGLREVNDSLQALQVDRAGLAQAVITRQQSEKLLASTQEQITSGTVSRTAAIDAEVNVIESRIAQSDAQARALIASVDVIQALGGIWGTAD